MLIFLAQINLLKKNSVLYLFLSDESVSYYADLLLCCNSTSVLPFYSLSILT